MRVLWLVLALLGCASEEARRQALERHAAEEAAQNEAAGRAYRERVYSQCRAYGFAVGTPQFSNCLMQVDMANHQQNAQTQNIVLQQMRYEQAMPLCSSLSPFLAGYYKPQGRCQ